MLWLTYANSSLEVTAGGYVTFARGLALSLRRQDELSGDTTLFGGKAVARLPHLSFTGVAGVANPVMVRRAASRSIRSRRPATSARWATMRSASTARTAAAVPAPRSASSANRSATTELCGSATAGAGAGPITGLVELHHHRDVLAARGLGRQGERAGAIGLRLDVAALGTKLIHGPWSADVHACHRRRFYEDPSALSWNEEEIYLSLKYSPVLVAALGYEHTSLAGEAPHYFNGPVLEVSARLEPEALRRPAARRTQVHFRRLPVLPAVRRGQARVDAAVLNLIGEVYS